MRIARVAGLAVEGPSRSHFTPRERYLVSLALSGVLGFVACLALAALIPDRLADVAAWLAGFR